MFNSLREMPEAPVRVVLSNHATPDIRSKCRELGADEVFDKSNELDAMLSYCNRLGGAGAARAAQAVS